MSVIRESYNKAVSAVSDYLSNDGLMVGAKNPTPYFRLFRLDPKSERSTTIPTEFPTIWDRFKSNFLPKAQPIDDNIMRYVTNITITKSVGGSDKKKPKNECQVNIQFSVQEALDQAESLKNKDTFKPSDFDTQETVSGEWYLDFPYFANAQKLDEKLFITAGYSDLEPEDCVLDVVNLSDETPPEDKNAKTNRKVTKKGLIVKRGLTFRPYEVVFGGYVTRPSVTGAENGLISLSYSVTNLLSNPVSVTSSSKQQGKDQSPSAKKNAEILAKEMDKVLGAESPSKIIERYETGNGTDKFYEKLVALLKSRLVCTDAPASLQAKLDRGSTSSNFRKLLEYPLGFETYVYLDIPRNYVPYDPDRYGTGTSTKTDIIPAINVANLNADKPPTFAYSKSFADFMQRMCTAWGLAYMEYYFDDGKSVIYITPMTEFLKPGSQLLSSFKPESGVSEKFALLMRYGVEVVSFSYNQKPAVDVQDQSITATVWDIESNDWVTYKIDKEVIKKYYKDSPDKGDMFTQLFEWAKGDPDAFIIYFTKMAGEFGKKGLDPEKVPQGSGLTLSMKLKHPIPGILPGMSVVFDVGVENPDSIDVNKYVNAAGADPTQILPVFVSRPIYQITNVVTKLEAGGTIYSQEIECEG